MDTKSLTMNVATVAVELLVAILLFALLYGLACRLIRLAIGGTPGTGAGSDLRGRIAESMRRNVRLLAVVGAVVTSLGVVAADVWLVLRGEYLPSYTTGWVREISSETWIALGVTLGKILALVALNALVLRSVRRWSAEASSWAKNADDIKANDDSIEALFGLLTQTIVRCSWLGVAIGTAHLLGVDERVRYGALALLKVYFIIASARLLWLALDAVIDSLEGLSRKYQSPDNLLRYYDKLSVLVPFFRRCLEFVVYVTAATLVVLQVEGLASLADWGPRLIRIIAVVFLSRVVVELVSLLVEEALVTRATHLDIDGRRSRLTMVPLVIGTARYLIYFCAGVIILNEVGINPWPILAGAGVVGLAVGLGAQGVINDIVSGFTILFESYYLVGDYIQIGDTEGIVEGIDLDTTRIRDANGRLHILRNGKVEGIINYSKSYTYAVVEVGVAYESDLTLVEAALTAVGPKIQAQCSDVLEPTEVKGINAFAESEITYRTTTRVKPGRHRQVERALRRLIKDEFDARGIEIPYARRVVIMQNAEGRDERAGNAVSGGPARK